MGHSPAPKGERRRRRRGPEDGTGRLKKHEKRSNATLVAWTIVFGVVGLAAVAVFFVFWLKPFLDRRDRMAMEPTVTRKVVPEKVSSIPDIGEAEAIEIAKRAMSSRDPQDVEKSIVLGSSSIAEVIDYLAKLGDVDGEIVRYQWMNRLDTTRPDVKGVVVNFKKESKLRNRLILLVPDEEGNWKMDFPAFARLAVPSWDEFLAGSAKSSEVRVYVAMDQYYNGVFQEGEGWQCFGLASPDVPELLFGYCKTDNEEHKAVKELLEGRKMARATLEIERMEGAEKRQFRIKKVLAQDWAIQKPLPAN